MDESLTHAIGAMIAFRFDLASDPAYNVRVAQHGTQVFSNCISR
jgi:hypothetical protein